jgi:hypothetical protein
MSEPKYKSVIQNSFSFLAEILRNLQEWSLLCLPTPNCRQTEGGYSIQSDKKTVRDILYLDVKNA